jgi:redox-sensitive bicupin YhaK (pirin superfamily)
VRQRVHHDRLGLAGPAGPGVLNLMTAGRGIAHSEETPPRNAGIDTLYYLGCGRRDLVLVSDREPARVLLLGGAPFGETIGEVRAYGGRRLDTPPFAPRRVPG